MNQTSSNPVDKKVYEEYDSAIQSSASYPGGASALMNILNKNTSTQSRLRKMVFKEELRFHLLLMEMEVYQILMCQGL